MITLYVIYSRVNRNQRYCCIVGSKEKDPDYKGTRVFNTDQTFKDFKTGSLEFIKLLGWDIISVDGAEADDVIASIVAKYCHRCKV